MTTTLVTPPVGTALGNATYPHRIWHGVPDNIVYVHPDGDDSRDGATWGSAKETICAAHDELPAAGGTIYVAEGSDIGDQGLLIVGPGDPNYASPLTGWRQQKTGGVRIIGVGGQTGSVYGPQAQISLTGGSADPTKPWIWHAGTSASYYYKDLRIVYPSIAIRAGVASDLSSRGQSASSIVFDNVCANSSQVAAGGPTVDLGYTFWLWFINGSGFSGNANAATQVGEYIPAIDRGAAIYARGTTDVSGGFVMSDAVIGSGWFRLYLATTGSGSSWRIKEVLFEGSFAAYPVDAPIELFNATPVIGYSQFEQIDLADASGVEAIVRINKSSGTDEEIAKKIRCIDVSSVKGPATLINSQTVSPATRFNQFGFVDERLTHHADHGRKLFGPVAARVTNLAKHDASTWTAASPAGTVTTGKTAPDGTTGAAEVTASGFSQVVASNVTFAVGDFIVGGVWVRSPGGTTSFDGRLPYFCDINTANFTFVDGVSQGGADFRTSGDGTVGTDWQWVSFIREIAAIGNNPGALRAFVGGSNAAPLQYYAPMMVHLPVATYSKEEAYAFRMHMGTWPDGAAAGAVSTLTNQKLLSAGELEIDGALNHDGTTVGFYGVTPATRPSAYTQTYSTADKTHANFTSADLATTATTQTTPYGFATQAQGDNIATQFNLLRADLADLKQLVNSMIDDLQSLGILQ